MSFPSAFYTLICIIVTIVKSQNVRWVVTSSDQSKLFEFQSDLTLQSGQSSLSNIITINDGTTYQQIYGFGAALTQSSAYLLSQYKQQDSDNYWTLMNQLFNQSMDNDASFGINVLRYPVTSNDFILPSLNEFTMDDTYYDYNLSNMSLINAESYQIPVLQDILSINPHIKLIGSPWTGLPWLKTTKNDPYPQMYDGGKLDESDSNAFSTYANFFVKLLQLYEKQGISFWGLTLQNEPLYTPSDYAGMYMSSDQQIKLLQLVGPLLADFNVKIMAYDHNWDNTDYATQVLSDSTANEYADGVAWHCYAGDVSAQTTVHNSFPDKETFFTECASSGEDNFSGDMQWNINNLWWGGVENWSSAVTHWNLILDQNYGPHNGGCGTCRGTMRMNSDSYELSYFEVIYGIGHYGKYVNSDSGATRIDASWNNDNNGCLKACSWVNNDDDAKVMIVVSNYCGNDVDIAIQRNGQYVEASIPNGLTTFLW